MQKDEASNTYDGGSIFLYKQPFKYLLKSPLFSRYMQLLHKLN
jgi:hypothetical protein